MAKTYVDKYLNGSYSYITVMVRLEYVLRNKKQWDTTSTAITTAAKNCLDNVVKRWIKEKRKHKLKMTFVTVDGGRYGSDTFSDPQRQAVQQPLHAFFGALYDNKMSMEEWEDSFISVANTTNPGYIAVLQKIVAAKGSALLLVGGANFQHSADKLFQEIHSSKENVHYLGSDCY